MGQKVSPIGFRTGITTGWKSRWFAPKSNYGEFLVEDAKMRQFIDERLNRQPPYAAISEVEIERTREEVKLLIKTARPGLVIGPKGAEVDRLKSALEDLTDRQVSINIVEVKNPDLNAQLIAAGIAEQLKRRASFRRTLKQRAEATMQAGAKGVKIIISGRLGGAEMCRSETQIMGSIPLHTLEADVDYGFTPSFTTYGAIGVKVWVYRGMFGEQPSEEEIAAASAAARARRRRERVPPHSGKRRIADGAAAKRPRQAQAEVVSEQAAPQPEPAEQQPTAPTDAGAEQQAEQQEEKPQTSPES